jgi:tetratricopeptide (TPR) repeat protein
MANVHLSLWFLRLRKLKLARVQLFRVLEIKPDHTWAHWFLGQTYVLAKQYKKGIDEVTTALHISEENSLLNTSILSALGWAYALSGNHSAAERILNELKQKATTEYVFPFLLAKLCAALSKIDMAFQWLTKSYDDRDIAIVHILTDETINNLRNDKRFPELLKKMDLYNYLNHSDIKPLYDL